MKSPGERYPSLRRGHGRARTLPSLLRISSGDAAPAQCEPSLIVTACSTFTDMDSMMIPYCPLHFAAIESVEMLLRVDGRRLREKSAAAAAMLLSFVGRLQPLTFCGHLCMESA